MALGNTDATFDLGALEVHIAGVHLVRAGVVISEDAVAAARRAMRADAYEIAIKLGGGPGTATVITSDLTTEYVVFNSAYTS
jgi:glutamate N-acetyltransferase/amino-acid N-acetyltransferase